MTIRDGQSEFDTIELRLLDSNQSIRFFESARVESEYTNPIDIFSLTISDDQYRLHQEALKPGVKVQVLVNGRVQLTGYLDTVNEADHGSFALEGRNVLASTIMSQVDPHLKFVRGMTLKDVIASVLPSSLSQIDISDADNQKLIANITRSGEGVDPAAKKIEQLQPKPGESKWEYLQRCLRRSGAMLRARADGKGVIVDKPNYATIGMELRRRQSGPMSDGNNILQGSKRVSLSEQPTVVILYTRLGTSSTDTASSGVTAAVNELTGFDDNGYPIQSVLDLLTQKQWVKVKRLQANAELIKYRKFFGANPPLVTSFLKVENVQTQQELDNLARRTIAEKQKECFSYSAAVSGFGQGSSLWSVNTCIRVQDEVRGIRQPLFVLRRAFVKSRNGGTKTELTCILPYTLLLTE